MARSDRLLVLPLPPSGENLEEEETEECTYEDGVVMFLRQPGIFEYLHIREGEPVSSRLRSAKDHLCIYIVRMGPSSYRDLILRIQVGGVSTLHYLDQICNVHYITLTSLLRWVWPRGSFIEIYLMILFLLVHLVRKFIT